MSGLRSTFCFVQEVFGESLVTAPLDKNENELPSPEKLKRRIILKHKKLPEGKRHYRIPIQSITKLSVGSRC